MRLEEFLEKNNITRAKFADTVGISVGYLCNLCRGWRNPSLPLIRKIIKATNGQVNVGDLFNPEAPSRLRKKKIEKSNK